jgi:uncharacterized protein YciI
MCELCSDDPKARQFEQERMRVHAGWLRELANHYDGLASGKNKPHEGRGEVKTIARYVIRNLVDSFV